MGVIMRLLISELNPLHKRSLVCRERGTLQTRSYYDPWSRFPYFSLATPHRKGFPFPLPGDALCSSEFEPWEPSPVPSNCLEVYALYYIKSAFYHQQIKATSWKAFNVILWMFNSTCKLIYIYRDSHLYWLRQPEYLKYPTISSKLLTNSIKLYYV